MSLFENDQYRWRETFFVLFEEKDRPQVEAIQKVLKKLGPGHQVADLRSNEAGFVESLTLTSHLDFSAMDITYVSGEDVTEHVRELTEELRGTALNEEERAKLQQIRGYSARFDVYHFEQVVDAETDDDYMDPGSLLIVLEKLARLCHGVAIDPQSGTIM